MKSRQIIIQDEFEEPHESFWCDATHCDECKLRFLCFTSRNETIVVNSKELNVPRWRLRDGSSKRRAPRQCSASMRRSRGKTYRGPSQDNDKRNDSWETL